MFVFTDRHLDFLFTDIYLDACGYWWEIECFIFTWIWMLVFTNKDFNALFLYAFGSLCLLTGYSILHFYRDLNACVYWHGFWCFIFTWIWQIIWMLVFTNKDLNALFLHVFVCLCLQTRIWMLYFYRDLNACVYWHEFWCFIFTWICQIIWMLVFTNKDLNALFLHGFVCLCLQTGIWQLYVYIDWLPTGIWIIYFNTYFDAFGYWQGL